MADLRIDNISISGLSSCHLRHSVRAKRIRIELRPDCSLLIVVPDGAREDQWLTFVLSKKHWIERNLQKYDIHQPDTETSIGGFPSHIELLCTGQKYPVFRKTDSCKRTGVVEGSLNLACLQSSDEYAYLILRKWLIQQARNEFSLRLQQISNETGLDWKRLSIRGQKTRWGSCSATGNISLNYKMLFLPENLVDHVLLHELVHTREMNHSQRFWTLMKKYDLRCNIHRAELRRAGQLLPGWLANI